MLPGISATILGVVNTPISVALGGSAVSTADASSYTFSAVGIGTASSDRTVIVAAFARNSGSTASISSVTVGGLSATQQSSANYNVAGGSSVCGLYTIPYPTGTTDDVVVTLPGTYARAGVAVYAVYGLVSVTPSATASATNATTLNLNTNVTAGSVCIGAVYTNPNGSATWTGLTEDLDILIESANGLTTASALLSSAETPRTISCAIASGVATNIVGCTGVWS